MKTFKHLLVDSNREVYKGCTIYYGSLETLASAKQMCDYHIKEGFLPLTMWSHEDGIIVQLSYAINGVEQVRYHSLLSLDNGELPDCTFQQAIDFILNKGE